MKKTLALVVLALGAAAPIIPAQSPMRGLWVGEARLTHVTEVTVPLDENNIPRAPDPSRPTKTFDVANIRLLLHVDGLGQARILKDVAILKRTEDVLVSESDMSLVTDPRLFAEFPVQPGRRIASAVFDFGDQKATDAIQAVVDAAVDAAAASINGAGDLTSKSESEQAAALASARSSAQTAAQAVVDGADAEIAFATFLSTHLSSTQVDAIATASDPAAAAQSARDAAVALRDAAVSFYDDARGVTMVDAIVAAVDSVDDDGGSLTPEEVEAARMAVAQNTAAAFADVADEINRLLAGKLFGDLIVPVAEVAAELGAVRAVQDFGGAPGSAPVEVMSPAHGLTTGDEIEISGSGLGAYNGVHEITRISEDVFAIPVDFVSGGAIESFGGTVGAAPLEVVSVGHGLASGDRIVIANAGVPAYHGEHEVTVLDEDTFTVDVVVENPVGAPGDWTPVEGGSWKFSPAAIQAAVEAVPEENAAQAEALRIQGAIDYRDTRGSDAVALVVDTMVTAAVDAQMSSPSVLAADLADLGRFTLAERVVRFPLPDADGVRPNPREMAPTGDYNDFVRAANTALSANFQTSPALVAAAAAQGAFDESLNNPLHTDLSVRQQGLVAAANDRDVLAIYAAAARANRTELPLEGRFEIASGDARLRAELDPGEDLGPAGLTGMVVLPAMHPTNPFRHRRHPDHTVGFDIVRNIRLDFDGEPGEPLDRAGFGVSRVTGIYREEVTKPADRAQGGLHKPLGPNRDRGLIVEGTFELNRISLIDTLNAK